MWVGLKELVGENTEILESCGVSISIDQRVYESIWKEWVIKNNNILY